MSEIKIRFNPETDEVELLLGDDVVDKVETEVVESWVTDYNERHGFVKPEEPAQPTEEEIAQWKAAFEAQQVKENEVVPPVEVVENQE